MGPKTNTKTPLDSPFDRRFLDSLHVHGMSSRFCQWPTLEDEGANGITLSRLDDTASWAYKYSASTCCERLGCVGSTQCAVMHGQVFV